MDLNGLGTLIIYLYIFQNVNCWSRCEFIRLRIQYGTEISREIEYQSIVSFQDTFHFLEGVFFLYFLYGNGCEIFKPAIYLAFFTSANR